MIQALPAGLTASAVVSASAANLGPGFDSLGLALSLYDEIVVTTIDSGLQVEVEGEGRRTGSARPRASCGARRRTGADSRWGDGSRAGGALSQRHSAFARPGIVGRGRGWGARRRERHSRPKRVGHLDEYSSYPARLRIRGTPRQRVGGRTRRCRGVVDRARTADASTYSAVPLRLHPDIRIFSAIPEERSLTAATRVLLPGHVSHEDARFNVSRAALLVVALTRAAGSVTGGHRRTCCISRNARRRCRRRRNTCGCCGVVVLRRRFLAQDQRLSR